MKILSLPLMVIATVLGFSACNSSSGPKSFCTAGCLNDTLKFKGNFPLQPYVYISAKNCETDTITWSYSGMGVNRKLDFNYPLNKNYVSCFIKDTAYAWVLFNTCDNSRGYFIRLPFNKRDNIRRSSGAINRFDPKFSVEEGLVAYTDKGNIFVEDMQTGQAASMTFGKNLDSDLDAIHKTIDTVNVTRNRIWVKVKIDNAWKELEKNITMK